MKKTILLISTVMTLMTTVNADVLKTLKQYNGDLASCNTDVMFVGENKVTVRINDNFKETVNIKADEKVITLTPIVDSRKSIQVEFENNLRLENGLYKLKILNISKYAQSKFGKKGEDFVFIQYQKPQNNIDKLRKYCGF